MKTISLLGRDMLRALRKRGVNLPDPEPLPSFGSPVIIPPRPFVPASSTLDNIIAELDAMPCGKARQADIAGFDRRADREARWRRDGCLELERLVPFMKNAGVKQEIIEHAEEVLRDLRAARRHKYPEKGVE